MTRIICCIAKTNETKTVLKKDNKSFFDLENLVFEPSKKQLKANTETIKKLNDLDDFDIVEFKNDNNFEILNSNSSNSNAILVTNKCNSNCVMCPCSTEWRNADYENNSERMKNIISLLPDDERIITFTGGEPTLLKQDFLDTLKYVVENRKKYKIFILTNGRTLSDDDYYDSIINIVKDKARFAIPLYGYDSNTHDTITQSERSFIQTDKAIKKLINNKKSIEIRIVVTKNNYTYLKDIADYICKNYKGIEVVNFMAMETMGEAAKNISKVWMDYEECFKASKDAIKTLVGNGIDVALYNFPLCKVDKAFWPICERSISDYKVSYLEECSNCSVKELCGGIFKSTSILTKMKVKPII